MARFMLYIQRNWAIPPAGRCMSYMKYDLTKTWYPQRNSEDQGEASTRETWIGSDHWIDGHGFCSWVNNLQVD